jgi:hypothetical protein
MTDKFQVRYEVEDGYMGGARPQSFYISPSEIEVGMTDEQLESALYDLAHEDMLQKVQAAVSTEAAEFIQWARAVLAQRT